MRNIKAGEGADNGGGIKEGIYGPLALLQVGIKSTAWYVLNEVSFDGKVW
jgi:hypothetical protein